jgi:hypothetical protein
VAARGDLGSSTDSSCEKDDDFPNIPFFSFSFQSLFRVSCKHIFEKLNLSFSICTFVGSVRDALKDFNHSTALVGSSQL